ncbi:HAD hydrolase-like protein [Streptomyces sp. NPDC093111]|uniref:HAD family hydrolase n=1 Tax=unclassified Streptomyces TaxID=2593676 RepID=UPI000D1AF722
MGGWRSGLRCGCVPRTSRRAAAGATAYVGDTGSDVRHARAADLRAIAVSYGYADIADLTTAGPDLVLHTPPSSPPGATAPVPPAHSRDRVPLSTDGLLSPASPAHQGPPPPCPHPPSRQGRPATATS